MPDYCCVPGCKTLGTGHRFPAEAELRRRWIVAIKRIDPVTKKLWQPSKLAVVCSSHFTAEDYNSTPMGMSQTKGVGVERGHPAASKEHRNPGPGIGNRYVLHGSFIMLTLFIA